MSDMKGYAKAQAHYDAQMPPDEESRIVPCSECNSTGKDEEGETCRHCKGEGERESTPKEDAQAYQDAMDAKAEARMEDRER